MMGPPDLHDLERRLAALEARLGASPSAATEGAPAPSASSPSASSPSASDPAEDTAAGQQIASAPAHRVTGSRLLGDMDLAEPGDDDGTYWALTGLKRRYAEHGAVSFTGAVTTGIGPVEYQWDRTAEHLMTTDWAERAERLAALGHPLRLAILRDLLDGERTVAQLVDDLQLASTGVAYHHLNQMHTAGWVASPRRGVWTIPPSKIIPLMTIIVASEDA